MGVPAQQRSGRHKRARRRCVAAPASSELGRAEISESNGHGTAVSVGSASVSAAHNAADVTFARQMIPHHQQAVAMAQLAADRAANGAVKQLAAAIQSAPVGHDPGVSLRLLYLIFCQVLGLVLLMSRTSCGVPEVGLGR